MTARTERSLNLELDHINCDTCKRLIYLTQYQINKGGEVICWCGETIIL